MILFYIQFTANNNMVMHINKNIYQVVYKFKNMIIK